MRRGSDRSTSSLSRAISSTPTTSRGSRSTSTLAYQLEESRPATMEEVSVEPIPQGPFG